MRSPVSTLVFFSGEAAVISTPAPDDYDPAESADWTPGSPITVGVKGVWHDGHQDGMDARQIATFLIEGTSKPAGLKVEDSMVTRTKTGVTLTVLDVCERVYLAKTDGWVLQLGR